MGNTIDGFSVLEEPVTSEAVTDKSTERGRIVHQANLQYAVSSMQGWRASMEDNHVAVTSLRIKNEETGVETLMKDHQLFGVFDGHGGGFSSQYSGDNYCDVLTSRREWEKYVALDKTARSETPGVDLLKSALIGSFLDIDEKLSDIHKDRISRIAQLHKTMKAKGKSIQVTPTKKGHKIVTERREGSSSGRGSPSFDKEKIVLDRSGTTAVVVLLTPTHIICANAGDSRAILCQDGRVLPLSFDHKPSNPVELSRVHNAGGFVRMKRIDGDLAVSRGLGDFRYKLNDDLTWEQQKVTANPDVIVCPRTKKDEFVIVGCDGIWDVMENGDCAEMVQSILEKGETDVGALCEKMLDNCLERDSKDNMTVCMVTLPGCKIQKKTSSSSASGTRQRIPRSAVRAE